MKFKELLEEDNTIQQISESLEQLEESAAVTAAMTAIVASQGDSALSAPGMGALSLFFTGAITVAVLSTLFINDYMFDGWLTSPIKNLRRLLANKKARKELQTAMKGFMERNKDNDEIKSLAVQYVKAKTHKRKGIAAKMQILIADDPILKQRDRFLRAVREMGAG